MVQNKHPKREFQKSYLPYSIIFASIREVKLLRILWKKKFITGFKHFSVQGELGK